jgi:hypothetical protein
MAIDFDNEENMYLCAKHKRWMYIAKSKGKMALFKYAARETWTKAMDDIKREIE